MASVESSVEDGPNGSLSTKPPGTTTVLSPLTNPRTPMALPTMVAPIHAPERASLLAGVPVETPHLAEAGATIPAAVGHPSVGCGEGTYYDSTDAKADERDVPAADECDGENAAAAAAAAAAASSVSSLSPMSGTGHRSRGTLTEESSSSPPTTPTQSQSQSESVESQSQSQSQSQSVESLSQSESPLSSSFALPTRRVFSFAAAGWMQCYHYGVAKAIVDAGQHNPNNLYVGSSAGALAAAAIVGNTNIDTLMEYANQSVENCHKRWYHAFCLREYVRRGIQIFAVEQYAKDKVGLQAKLNSQLEVYATLIPAMQSKCFTEFNEEEDLEEALLASCLIAPLAGLPFRLRGSGEWVIDGGLAAFQPRSHEPHTICVSALYFGSADIRPSKFVPVWWGLYPPSVKECRDLFALGYSDALDFFVREGTLSPYKFTELREKYPRVARLSPEPKFTQVLIESIVFIFFIFFLRPLGLLLVYGEMVMVAVVSFLLALLHDLLPTTLSNIVATRAHRRMHHTRHAAWRDAYHAVRNLVSLRVPLHMVLGRKVPVNAARLETYSRMYRLFRPVWSQ